MQSTRQRRAPRASSPPEGDGGETLEIHTHRGPPLRATLREPARRAKLKGTVVLAHAMFARRSEFERPREGGLGSFLATRGWRTIAFDFRGHGDSGPGAAAGATWSYDDLVREDLPAVVASARARSRRNKVVVVGHALGGHVALAAQGTGALGADAIAMFASNVWLRELEPSRLRWAMKRAAIAAVDSVVRRKGFFPARALGLGSDDEAARSIHALSRAVRDGHWGSDDGRVSYLEALARVAIPVRAIASDGDFVHCHPDCAERFVRRVTGPVTFDRIAASDDGGKAPGHMELVTTARAASAWARLEQWMTE